MGQKRQKLTVELIKATPAPVSGRKALIDSDAKGLQLRITDNDSRSWYWVGKTKGKLVYVKIGDYPTIPIKRARLEAIRIAGEVIDGKPPQTMAQVAAQEMTLFALHHWYMENVSKPHRSSWKQDQKKFELYWQDFQYYRLSDITKAAVTEQHVQIGKDSGPVAANLAVSFLSSMYLTAIKKLDYTGANPTIGVTRFKTSQRERFLSEAEIVKFFDAVKTLTNHDARDIFILCLLTGARRGNVASMEWAEIDEGKMLWTVPKAKSKTRKELKIILVPEAMAIIKARPQTAQFVFQSKRASRGHYTWPKNSWKLLCEAAGFKGVVIHDLRRTFASYQASENVSLHTIAKTIGHGSVEATKIYARLQLDPIRQAVATGVAAILQARDSGPPVKPGI